MGHIQVSRHGSLLILTLSRGKANALNAAMLDEFCRAVADAVADVSVRGLVLASDRPRFFCTGFDIKEVFQYNRDQMSSFFGRFTELYGSLRRCPKPVVAALSGHTYAGGAILSLACDFRVMAEGDFGFAVNEINLGVVPGLDITRMLIDAVGANHARAMLLLGEAVSPARALAVGLVHELAAPEAVLDRALALARALADKSPEAFRETKRTLQEAGGDGPASRIPLDPFLDMWFSPQAEQRRHALKVG